MTFRKDEDWMYEKSEDYRPGSKKYKELKTREWYAANDTRIGGSSHTESSYSFRTDYPEDYEDHGPTGYENERRI